MRPVAKKKPDLGYALGLPPRDAVAYLESLGVRPTSSWHDLWEEARAGALTVAGMTRMDLLRDVRQALARAVSEGWTQKDFIERLGPELGRKGWTGQREVINPETGEVRLMGRDLPARLALVFDQNVQTAYMTGRYRAMLANADARPWWMYVAILDSRTRPHHRALHRKVFRYDDPFWRTHYPPNGFRCRCRVRALDDEDLHEEDLTPENGEDHMVSREVVINPRAPENDQVTRTVWGYRPVPGGPVHWADPGFSWNPGYVTWGLDHDLAQKLDDLKSPALYAQVVEALNSASARHAAFGVWITGVLERGQARGDAAVLGIVRPEVVEAARARGLNPARLAVMTDDRVRHADREAHQNKGTALSTKQYRDLAAGFAQPEAIYWDARHNNALYVLPDPDPDWCVLLPLYMPSRSKSAAKKLGRFDGTATAYRARRSDLLGRRMEQIKMKK